MSEWGPIGDADTIARALAPARRVVVCTHTKPDGDAVGSTLAVARALMRGDPGRVVEVWYSGTLPDWMGEIAGSTAYRVAEGGATPGLVGGSEADAIVITDTGAWSQLEALQGYLRARTDRTLVIDHHLHGDADLASARWVDPRSGSASELVAEVCARLLGVRGATALPREIATAVYLGLATDTGWFRFSNVRAATLRLAADLIEGGVDHTGLYRLVEQRDKAGRIRLMGRALAGMELFDDGRVALMTLRLSDFEACRAGPGDSSGFADRALSIESVLVACVLTEAVEGGEGGSARTTLSKVSMRSKDGPGAVDVNEAARRVGGGGHARAAGARLRVPMEEARAAVLGALGVKV